MDMVRWGYMVLDMAGKGDETMQTTHVRTYSKHDDDHWQHLSLTLKPNGRELPSP